LGSEWGAEEEIEFLRNEIQSAESELEYGELDPGETFELKKQLKRMRSELRQMLGK